MKANSVFPYKQNLGIRLINIVKTKAKLTWVIVKKKKVKNFMTLSL